MMQERQVLQVGSKGYEVTRWQTWLRGRGFYEGKVDGIFGPITRLSTRAFQKWAHIGQTGAVDECTLGAAVMRGFDPTADDDSWRSPNWPEKPPSLMPLDLVGKQRVFGSFRYVANPTSSNPEGIKILDGWAKGNIVQVKVPRNKTQSRVVLFHWKGAEKLQALFETWQKEGLLPLIKTFDGSYVPRFIRGSRTVLSNHAFGTAFDINARWNYLGAVPALCGDPGSVRELVISANNLGFFWGGHYPGRKDGMHFELVKV